MRPTRVKNILLLSTATLCPTLIYISSRLNVASRLAVVSTVISYTIGVYYNYNPILFKQWLHKFVSGNNRQSLSGPPGASLNALADFFCSPKTMERIVRPIISDMQFEYFKALAEKRKAKAIWIRIRGCWGFWKALGIYTVVKNLVEIWKISGMG